MVATSEETVSIDGFHLIHIDNLKKNIHKRRVNDFKSFVNTSKRNIRNSYQQFLSWRGKNGKRNSQNSKQSYQLPETSKETPYYNYDFHNFLNDMIELGRHTKDVQDKSKYENLMQIVTSPRTKDVFNISSNVFQFCSFLKSENRVKNKIIKKHMKDYFKLDRQSAKINDVSEILTINRVNVVYSTYQKIVDLTVKSSACVFRTDSQQKYESCLSGNSVKITKQCCNKKLEDKKLLSTMDSSKINFKIKNNVNGMNFESMQVVNLELNIHESIGITLVNEYNNSILIARVIKGQAADQCELLKVGDEIFEVNDEPVKGMEIEEVINVIENQKKTGSISFLICHESLAKKIQSIRH
uniref:MAGUK p55 subfamily member 7 (Trinotate prediction) n=1 Tax=Myxobolus squamalis TaxID=59785 RepID=A0A6B2FX66_MYXSQ